MSTTTTGQVIETPGLVLERTARRLKQHFQQQLSAAGAEITIDQWVVLRAIARDNGLSQLDLAKATYKDAPTLTRIIDLLCQKGLVERQPDEADRRRFCVYSTAAGRDKLAEAAPVMQAARAQAWEGIPPEKLEELIATLNMVYDNLQ